MKTNKIYCIKDGKLDSIVIESNDSDVNRYYLKIESGASVANILLFEFQADILEVMFNNTPSSLEKRLKNPS